MSGERWLGTAEHTEKGRVGRATGTAVPPSPGGEPKLDDRTVEWLRLTAGVGIVAAPTGAYLLSEGFRAEVNRGRASWDGGT